MIKLWTNGQRYEFVYVCVCRGGCESVGMHVTYTGHRTQDTQHMTQDWKYPCQRSLITHLTPNRYIIIEFSFYDLLVSIASLNWIQNVYTKAYLVAIWRIVCACELIGWKWILCVSEWASESVDWWNNFYRIIQMNNMHLHLSK